MDKHALIQELTTYEKTQAVVRIKLLRSNKIITGTVEKVLSQVIIVKSTAFNSAAFREITITLSEIGSISRYTITAFTNFSKFRLSLRRMLKRPEEKI